MRFFGHHIPRAPCFHWNVCFVDAVGIHHHYFSCYMGSFPQSGVRHLFNSAAFGFSNLVTFQLSSQFSFFPFGRFYVVSYHLHPLYFCWPFSQLCFLMFSWLLLWPERWQNFHKTSWQKEEKTSATPTSVGTCSLMILVLAAAGNIWFELIHT